MSEVTIGKEQNIYFTSSEKFSYLKTLNIPTCFSDKQIFYVQFKPGISGISKACV